MNNSDEKSGVTRRTVVASGAVVVAAGVGHGHVSAAAAAETVSEKPMPVRMTINGKQHAMNLDPRVTLLDALREHLQLTGTKKGCDHGQCGACTVVVEGRRINSCLTLAVMHDGDNVTTIEGLGTPQDLHPMQAAFVKHDGFQCGYCTPGQIMSAVSVLDEIADGIPSHVSSNLVGKMKPSDAEIRERMSGNLCRCAAYANILAAVRDVAGAKA